MVTYLQIYIRTLFFQQKVKILPFIQHRSRVFTSQKLASIVRRVLSKIRLRFFRLTLTQISLNVSVYKEKERKLFTILRIPTDNSTIKKTKTNVQCIIKQSPDTPVRLGVCNI